MAIKGNFNGSSSSNNGGNGNRGRPYGVMLLVAFGAALLGVLVVHKLRERRIFNLLVTDKEQQLFSLHLLLQKEKEQSSEMSRKAEDMKAAMQKLTTEKMELERRVAELQSTIDSLKDEGKTLEIALEEKESEIKLLRRDATPYDVGDKESNTQVAAALTQSLKQKEAGIQELKKHHHNHHHHHRGVGVENTAKVRSAGSDNDPSANHLSTNGTMAADDNAVAVGEEKKDDSSRKLSDGENAVVENNGTESRRNLSREEEEEGLLPAAAAGTTSQGEAVRKRKHVHSRKARGKKWGVVARNRWLGTNNMSHENNDEEGEEDKRITSTAKEKAVANDETDSSGAQFSKPENSDDSLKRRDRLGKGTQKLEEAQVVSQSDGWKLNNADSMYNKESESVSGSSEQGRDEYNDETDPSKF